MHYIHQLVICLVLVSGWTPYAFSQTEGVDTLQETYASRSQGMIDSKVTDWQQKQKELGGKLRTMNRLDTLKVQQLEDGLPRLPFDSSTSELTGLQVKLSKGFSSRQGNYPGEEPGNFTRVTLQGKGTLFGLPLTSRGFISNEQSPWRPPMNGLSLGLDIPGLRKEVTQALNQEIHELKRMIDPTSLGRLSDLDKLLGAASDWAEQEEMIGQMADYLLQPEAWEKELEAALEERKQEVDQTLDALGTENADLVADSIAVLRLKVQQLRRQLPQTPDSLSMVDEKVMDLRRQWHHQLMQEKSNRLEVLALIHYRDSIQQHDPEKWVAYQRAKALEEVKEMDPSDQRQALRASGLIQKGQALMQSVTAFELGMSHPTYTDLTFSGQAVNGLHMEMEPGRAFFAATSGKGANLNLAGNSNRRRFFALGAGWGARQKLHLRLTAIRSADVAKSFQPDTLFAGINDTIVHTSPRNNGVLSLAGQWRVSKGLRFHAEMAQSRTAGVDSSIVESTFHVGNATLGRALQAGFSFRNNSGLVYDGKWERIEKGYQSFGVPFLRNDLEGFELRAQQSLFDRQLTLAPWMSAYQDRLGGEAAQSTSMTTYGASAIWKAEQGPEVQLSHLQSHLSGRLEQIVTQWNGALTYPYQLRELSMISRVTWNRTNQRQSSADSLELNTNQQLLVSQLLRFTNGWLWSTTFNRLVGTSLHPRNQRLYSQRPQFQTLATEYVDQVWNIVNSRLQMRWWGTWSTTVGGTIGKGTTEGFQWGWQADAQVPIGAHFQLGVQIRFRDVESQQHDYRLFDGVFSAQVQF